MPNEVVRYPRYRFPPAIISHAVWLYYRFTLSFRDVEDLLAHAISNTSATAICIASKGRSARTRCGARGFPPPAGRRVSGFFKYASGFCDRAGSDASRIRG
jgi:hypothetical protein